MTDIYRIGGFLTESVQILEKSSIGWGKPAFTRFLDVPAHRNTPASQRLSIPQFTLPFCRLMVSIYRIAHRFQAVRTRATRQPSSNNHSVFIFLRLGVYAQRPSSVQISMGQWPVQRVLRKQAGLKDRFDPLSSNLAA